MHQRQCVLGPLLLSGSTKLSSEMVFTIFAYVLLFDVVADKSKQMTDSHGKDNNVGKYLSSILGHALAAVLKAKAGGNLFELS